MILNIGKWIVSGTEIAAITIPLGLQNTSGIIPQPKNVIPKVLATHTFEFEDNDSRLGRHENFKFANDCHFNPAKWIRADKLLRIRPGEPVEQETNI